MRPTFRHATLAAVLLPVLWVAATAQPVTQWLNKAIELDTRKDWPALLEHTLRWTKAHPGSSEAWSNLGNAYALSGQRDKVLEVHKRLKTLDSALAEHFLKVVVMP